MSSETNQTEDTVESTESKQNEGAVAFSVEELQRQLVIEQRKATENLESWQRARADFQNLKRRTDNERLTIGSEAREKLLVRLLPIVDDFERALQSLPESLKDEPWIKGVSQIERKLKSLLEQEGVSEIVAQDQEFNPHFHEAVHHEEDSQGEKDYVTAVYAKGYKMGDKIIRPAMVQVGRK